MRKLYGIGTGPGDPELMTVKAVRVMEDAAVVFAPNNKGINMAVDIARDYIGATRKVFIDLPMGRVTREDYVKAAQIIDQEIPEGEYGVFLTIGDPMIYSTFIYIMEELQSKKLAIEVIPGIPSFVAAAAQAKTPLTVKGDSFLLCDELDEDLLEESLVKVDSIALLKTHKNKEKTIEKLTEQGFDYKYVKRVTLAQEEILTDKEKILEEKDYMSLILARKVK